MVPQHGTKLRTAIFGQFCTSLRKDSVANYAWNWTLFLSSVRRLGSLGVLYNALKVGFTDLSVGGTTIRKFSKTKTKICSRVVPNTLYSY